MAPSQRRPIGELLRDATEALYAVEVSDTSTVLEAGWYGFCVAGAAGALLSICADQREYPPLWHNAEPVLATAISMLRQAPSLPAGLPTEVNPAGGPDDRLDDPAAQEIRTAILTLTLALNTVLPRAAERAGISGDREACRQTTMLAAELADCYEGRLRSFLNPYRTSFGPGSFVVRGQGRRPKPSRRPDNSSR
jgi:hypothetical protein